MEYGSEIYVTPSEPEEEEFRQDILNLNTNNNDEHKKQKKEKKIKKKKKDTTFNTDVSYNSGSVQSSIFLHSSSKRQLELEAYASIVTAFRSQGELTWKKESILQELRTVLKVSEERHKMEIKRSEQTLANANLLFATNRKWNGSYGEGSSGSNSSASEDDSSSEDEKPRKRHKTYNEKGGYFAAHPLPSSENQPAYVNRTIPRSKSSKKKEEKSKDKKKRSSKKNKVFEKDEKSKTSEIFTNTQSLSQLDLSPLKENGVLPPDIQAAKDSGDLERLKEALEKHKQKVRNALEALKE